MQGYIHSIHSYVLIHRREFLMFMLPHKITLKYSLTPLSHVPNATPQQTLLALFEMIASIFHHLHHSHCTSSYPI